MAERLVAAERLARRFGDAAAVRDVTFGVDRGEVVALLGHNGAGKSTTMRILAGALVPTGGRATVAGIRCDQLAARRHVGWLPETPPLTAELTVLEQLRFAARLRGAPAAEVERVSALCELLPLQDALTSILSKGMKQRVGLAQALIGDPEVLLLDEPTAGLDPGQAAATRALIRTLGEQKAVLLSTHLLSDVAALCARAVLMSAGKSVAEIRLDEPRARGALEETVLAALDGATA
jgi:ABC-2 type transport system ATP-binding protein